MIHHKLRFDVWAVLAGSALGLVWIAAEAFLAVMISAIAGLVAGGRLSW